MVRLRIRCRCIALAIILSQVFIGFWFYSQPLDPVKLFLSRLFSEGGQSILHLTDLPVSSYYQTYGKDFCVREGTVVKDSSEGNCICHSGWKGSRCGVPLVIQKAVWMQMPDLAKSIHLRKRARRVILVSPFTLEYDIFEANVHNLIDLVDVHIIGETYHTSIMDKAQPILSRLKRGWLKTFQDKIIYVPLNEGDVRKSSFVQNLVQTGLRLVSDIRPDDLFILTSGEEILSRNVVVFLKLFQGYPLPVKCQFKKYLYGFYWSAPDSGTSTRSKVCVASFQFLANAFEYQVARLEEGSVLEEDLNFFLSHEQPVINWTIQDAGWRCHLCLKVKDILDKFISDPVNQPKWLVPDSNSSMLPFIQRLIKFGQDENLDPVGSLNDDIDELPLYFKHHQDKYNYLIRNPYEMASIHNLV